MMERGCEIAEALQVAIATKVLDVRWAKHLGNMYRPGFVVCLKVLNEMPVFTKSTMLFLKMRGYCCLHLHCKQCVWMSIFMHLKLCVLQMDLMLFMSKSFCVTKHSICRCHTVIMIQVHLLFHTVSCDKRISSNYCTGDFRISLPITQILIYFFIFSSFI